MIEPTNAHVWPNALTRVAAQRDRARNAAVRLEQDLAETRDRLEQLRSRINYGLHDAGQIAALILDAEELS